MTRAKSETARIVEMLEALQPLVNIANAYDNNALDGDARKAWGPNNETMNLEDSHRIELYFGRDGERLLTLAHCFRAREAARRWRFKR